MQKKAMLAGAMAAMLLFSSCSITAMEQGLRDGIDSVKQGVGALFTGTSGKPTAENLQLFPIGETVRYNLSEEQAQQPDLVPWDAHLRYTVTEAKRYDSLKEAGLQREDLSSRGDQFNKDGSFKDPGQSVVTIKLKILSEGTEKNNSIQFIPSLVYTRKLALQLGESDFDPEYVYFNAGEAMNFKNKDPDKDGSQYMILPGETVEATLAWLVPNAILDSEDPLDALYYEACEEWLGAAPVYVDLGLSKSAVQ